MTAIRLRGRLLRWQPGLIPSNIVASPVRHDIPDNSDLPPNFAFNDEMTQKKTVDIDLEGMRRPIHWMLCCRRVRARAGR